MTRYLDLIAYPIAMFVVYVFLGLMTWNRDPGNWSDPSRILWIIWGLAWGEALRMRIKKDITCSTSSQSS